MSKDKNMGFADQALRMTLALMLLWVTIFTTPTGGILFWIGVGICFLLGISGLMGFDPIYNTLGFNTLPNEEEGDNAGFFGIVYNGDEADARTPAQAVTTPPTEPSTTVETPPATSPAPEPSLEAQEPDRPTKPAGASSTGTQSA